jgi:adenine/guanine phosphoribosyltransferase-like PRPP-binding protein
MYENGITSLPTVSYKVKQSADWQSAKSGNYDCAVNIVNALWSNEHTQELAKILHGKPAVFIAVPSTSTFNELPNALGIKLAAQLDRTYVDVRELYRAKTVIAMKNVPKDERPFADRDYTLKNAADMRSLAGKQVVVVEDVFSTGSSARQFVIELHRHNISIKTVVGLMGNARLDAPPQLVSKFQKALRNTGVEVKGRDLANVLSAGEIEAVINSIHKAGDVNARNELAGKLQWILDKRTAGPVAQHTNQDAGITTGSRRDGSGDARSSG